MPRYIVTGGAGFIGSAVVWKLNQLGIDDILVVDHLGESDKWKNLRALVFRDYLEKDEFLNLYSEGKIKADVLIHMGACSNTMEYNASYMIKNNFEYSRELFGISYRNGTHFIYASSGATYGDGSSGFSDDFSVLYKLRPLNIYGYSKHIFDIYLYRNRFLFTEGIMVVGLKFFNVFGPNEYHKGEMRSKVIKAYEEISKEGKIKLFKSYVPEYGDGEQKRDFVYVKDVVEVVAFFIDKLDSRINGIYNVGSGRARSWNDLAKAIFDALELPVNIEYIDMPDFLKKRYQYFTEADISKLRNIGYLKPFTNLEDAVREYIRDYIKKERYLGDED